MPQLRRDLPLVPLLTIALFLAACGPAGTLTPTPTIAATLPGTAATATSQPVAAGTATSRAPSSAPYPVGCAPSEIETFLKRFFDAVNRGDEAMLPDLFPSEAIGQGVRDYSGEKFVWYSMTDQRPDGSKRHFVAYDLPILWAYFAERHAQHETLRLAFVRVSTQDTFTANLTLNIFRTADDLSPAAGFPPGQATGKGVINCRDKKILVLSLGQGQDSPTPPTAPLGTPPTQQNATPAR